jgi:hypothetical protein
MTHASPHTTPPVARELAPAGLRSSPKWPDAVCQPDRASQFYDGCAAEREQAPSPQKLDDSARLFRGRTSRHRATPPCAIAYNYARIRRLVRLEVGLYRFQVADESAIGFGSPGKTKAHSSGIRSVDDFRRQICYGGCARGALVARWVCLGARSTNLRIAAT